jgi:cell division septum initiation protein DivIVA
MRGENDVMTELTVVRRGYDPGQVQRLVGELAGELKALSAESDALRARVHELEQPAHTAATAVAAAHPAEPDVFAHWSRETNALLDAARSAVEAVRSQADADALAIRASARAEADQLLAEARREADEMIAAAQLHHRVAKSEADAVRATVEREVRAELASTLASSHTAKAEIARLMEQRGNLAEQLQKAREQLTQLLALIAPPAEPSDPADAAH